MYQASTYCCHQRVTGQVYFTTCYLERTLGASSKEILLILHLRYSVLFALHFLKIISLPGIIYMYALTCSLFCF